MSRGREHSQEAAQHHPGQELKGNIRVFCRIHPYLGKEASEDNNSMEHYDLNQP
ncbi:hypothetical protein PROFUN_16381, partial [Planoprotostelium fungivorum]